MRPAIHFLNIQLSNSRANKPKLDNDDYDQIADLEMYLDEIPDYLALKLTTEYKELKAKLRNREV